jgi:hypothetical protein
MRARGRRVSSGTTARRWTQPQENAQELVEGETRAGSDGESQWIVRCVKTTGLNRWYRISPKPFTPKGDVATDSNLDDFEITRSNFESRRGASTRGTSTNSPIVLGGNIRARGRGRGRGNSRTLPDLANNQNNNGTELHSNWTSSNAAIVSSADQPTTNTLAIFATPSKVNHTIVDPFQIFGTSQPANSQFQSQSQSQSKLQFQKERKSYKEKEKEAFPTTSIPNNNRGHTMMSIETDVIPETEKTSFASATDYKTAFRWDNASDPLAFESSFQLTQLNKPSLHWAASPSYNNTYN